MSQAECQVECKQQPSESPAKATQRRKRLASDLTETVLNDKITGGAYGRLTIEYVFERGVIQLVELSDQTRIK